MPHKCTNCEAVYTDGDKQILSGCTSCGGQKFEFVNKKSASTGKNVENTTDETEETTETNTGTDEDDIIVADEERPVTNVQEKARSEFVSSEELEKYKKKYKKHNEPKLQGNSGPSQEDTTESLEKDMDELRNVLNEQFEGIKILEPGKYELNLMELYDREEHIISLQEDGRYIIQFPEDVASN